MRVAVGRKTLISALTMVGVLIISSASSYALDGYGSRGSWGGSGGSRGSSGGSWGSGRYGSSGGGPLRRLVSHFHHRHHGSSGGSWGGSSGGNSGGSSGHRYAYRSWGSSGGSSGGSYIVNGSSGGSSGGAYYSPSYSAPVYYSDGAVIGSQTILSTPGASTPGATNPSNVDANKAPITDPPASGSDAQPANPQNPGSTNPNSAINPTDARLRLKLPADAVVFVNGKQTKTPGELRSYVSRNLESGKWYPYEIKAVVNRDGKDLVQTKVVDLTAGMDKLVPFDFDGSGDVLTSLSLTVPEDAQVKLGGSTTAATGSFRYFSTKQLTEGQTWKEYEIVVTVVRDGKEVSRREVIELAAGESRQIAFDFEGTPALMASK